jgi:adenylate cyclase
MHDDPGLDAEGEKDLPRSVVRFSGFLLDIDANMLTRDSGEEIPLTRGEFSLLSCLAGRPGRVVSRETLLAVTANRRFEPFDRSIDTLVGRLRRKIEPDPKQPRLIVTVPGKGYRFDGLTLSLPASPLLRADDAAAPSPRADPPLPAADVAAEAPPEPAPAPPWLPVRVKSLRPFGRVSAVIAVCLGALALVGLGGDFLLRRAPAAGAAPGLAVLPFANLTGDPTRDYLGRVVAYGVLARLSADPGLRVVAQPDAHALPAAPGSPAAGAAGVRYAVTGAVQQIGENLQVIATVADVVAGETIWSEVFGPIAPDGVEIPEDVPRRIYDAIAGFRGAVRRSEERLSWSRGRADTSEYGYYVRGQSRYLRSTLPDVLWARQIFQEGLERYPQSGLLRLELAWTHVWTAMARVDQHPGPDIDEAWRLAGEVSSAPSPSPLEAWLGHWLMAFLYQWHDNDFSRSVSEARKAADLAPYDAFSRSELSRVLANAGLAEEAIAWARDGVEHDRYGDPPHRRANLAWAYYMAGRNREAVETLRQERSEFPVLAAALHVRLGELETAKALIAEYRRNGGRDTVHREDVAPLIEPAGTEYVESLRKAGMPD